MAFDKVKTLTAAEKYLELGKIPAAIKEYCAIVEHEPDDFTTLNMLGDLYVRVNNRAAAISCFRKIAEHYREQDFVLKSIAMFKKIDRVQPGDPEIALSLADLYAQQHLVVDARAHYLVVAESYKKSGATEQGLEILRKIANLDPQNTEVRLKLAEGYLKQNMRGEAAAAFTEAAQHLLGRGLFEKALDACSRALDIFRDDYVALKGLLAAHAGRGTAAEAAKVIAQSATDNPGDVPLLSLLVTAYILARDVARAESTTATLVAQQPSEYVKYLDVARLYLEQNQISDAIRLIENVAEQLLAEREESQLLGLVEEVLNSDSDNVSALRLLVRVYWWQRDADNVKIGLERLAAAAQAQALVDDERYALTQLARLSPESAEYAERLEQLGGPVDTPDEELFAEPDAASSMTLEPDQFTFGSNDARPVDESEFEWNSVPANEGNEDLSEEWTEPSITFEAVVAEELSVSTSEAGLKTENESEDDRADLYRRQELESVDFYIGQGYVDIAHDTLNLLEQQFGPHEDIESRRQKLNAAATVVLEGDNQTRVTADAVPSEAVTSADHSSPQSSVTDIEGVRIAPPSAPTIHPELAEIFEEYRVSAEAETIVAADADYETHYNLGLAYKEMDLFEEALEEFQIAVKMVSADDGTSRYLQCCNLLGHCLVKKGVPQAAISWFSKGLNAAGASDDERQALRYELGAAYEQMGDLKRALDFFTEVYGNNVTYRGVKDRMQTLQARIAGDNGASVPQLTPVRTSEELLN